MNLPPKIRNDAKYQILYTWLAIEKNTANHLISTKFGMNDLWGIENKK